MWTKSTIALAALAALAIAAIAAIAYFAPLPLESEWSSVSLPWESERPSASPPRASERLPAHTFITQPMCTGSMEPEITCLDDVILSSQVKPEELVVGDIISFSSDSCGMDALHRVVEIFEEDGQFFFDTKGDNNPEPDGCRISVDEIDGYVIGMERRTRPEMATIRHRVNSAVEKFDAVLEEYDAAVERYDQAVELYDELLLEHCPHNPDTCQIPAADYPAVMEAYDHLQVLYDDLEELSERLQVQRCIMEHALGFARGKPLRPHNCEG